MSPTVDLCYVATTLNTDSDVNSSKAFFAQEKNRFKQLKQTKKN